MVSPISSTLRGRPWIWSDLGRPSPALGLAENESSAGKSTKLRVPSQTNRIIPWKYMGLLARYFAFCSQDRFWLCFIFHIPEHNSPTRISEFSLGRITYPQPSVVAPFLLVLAKAFSLSQPACRRSGKDLCWPRPHAFNSDQSTV